MLFKRYACPFPMLDEMISTYRFLDFISYLIKTVNRENKEKVQWDFFLHKVCDKSYGEFVEGLGLEIHESHPKTEVESSNLETTIKETIKIFNIELI